MLRVVIASQRLLLTILITIIIAAGCGEKVDEVTFKKAQAQKLAQKKSNATIFDGEKHFANIRQITFGGQNAEAYFSRDGSRLIFQSTRDGLSCDAIFTINASGTIKRQSFCSIYGSVGYFGVQGLAFVAGFVIDSL